MTIRQPFKKWSVCSWFMFWKVGRFCGWAELYWARLWVYLKLVSDRRVLMALLQIGSIEVTVPTQELGEGQHSGPYHLVIWKAILIMGYSKISIIILDKNHHWKKVFSTPKMIELIVSAISWCVFDQTAGSSSLPELANLPIGIWPCLHPKRIQLSTLEHKNLF